MTDSNPPGHEWLVTYSDAEVRPDGTHVTEERVPAVLGGINVAAMPLSDTIHFIVITSADDTVVWASRSTAVRRITRCAG